MRKAKINKLVCTVLLSGYLSVNRRAVTIGLKSKFKIVINVL